MVPPITASIAVLRQAASSIFEDIVITKRLQKRAIRKLIENQNMFRNHITHGK
jgi:hypothetical protein